MMNDKDVLFNFILVSRSNDRDTIISALTRLEEILNSADKISKRVRFLISLRNSALKSGISCQGLGNPLNQEQMTIIVRKGIVESYISGEIESGRLLKLGHSIDGLIHFAETLFSIPSNQYAPCWSDSLHVQEMLLGLKTDSFQMGEKTWQSSLIN